MGTRLYLVRHGETEWNVTGRFQGHSDIPLSTEGKNQAEKLSHLIKRSKVNSIYASDLSRAVETAEIIINKYPSKLNINITPDLREINFGLWEGLTIDEIKAKYHSELMEWWDNPSKVAVPGGELLSDVVCRVINSVQHIANMHPDENVLIVSHGGVIRSIICTVMGMDINRYWQLHLDNCSLSIIHLPEGILSRGIIELYNCTYNKDYE